MIPSIFLDNKKYISSKEASSLTGYSKDYIGQLARGNKIDSKKINGIWYVSEESILNYKNFLNKSGLMSEVVEGQEEEQKIEFQVESVKDDINKKIFNFEIFSLKKDSFFKTLEIFTSKVLLRLSTTKKLVPFTVGILFIVGVFTLSHINLLNTSSNISSTKKINFNTPSLSSVSSLGTISSFSFDFVVEKISFVFSDYNNLLSKENKVKLSKEFVKEKEKLEEKEIKNKIVKDWPKVVEKKEFDIFPDFSNIIALIHIPKINISKSIAFIPSSFEKISTSSFDSLAQNLNPKPKEKEVPALFGNISKKVVSLPLLPSVSSKLSFSFPSLLLSLPETQEVPEISLFRNISKKVASLPSSLEKISTSSFDSLAQNLNPKPKEKEVPALFGNVSKKITHRVDSLTLSYNLAKEELSAKKSPLKLGKEKVILTASSLDSTSSSSFNKVTGKVFSIFNNYNKNILKPAGNEINEILKDYKRGIAFLLLGNEDLNNKKIVEVELPEEKVAKVESSQKKEEKKTQTTSNTRSSVTIIKNPIYSPISDTQLLFALRNLLQKGLPQDVVVSLRGPMGPQGPQGPQGINSVQSTTPVTFNTTVPSASQSGPIGILGGFVSLGAQDISTSTFQATGNSSIGGNFQVSGISNLLGELNVSGSSTFSGSVVVTNTFNPSLTLGSIFFQGDSGLTEDNANFFWDNTNKRLGIGTTSPSASLDIRQITNGDNIFYAQRNTDISPSGDFILYKNAAGDTNLFRVDNSGNMTANGSIFGGAVTITATTTPQLRVQYDGLNEWTSSTNASGISTILFNGSTPRAIFIPQTDSITAFQFQKANGTNVLNIDTENGRVGIGTTTPQALLHTKSAINTDSLFIIDTTTADTGGSDAYLSLREAGVEKWKIRNQGDNNDVLKISSATVNPVLTISQAGGFGLGYTNDPGLGSMIISGNVGIGNTAPGNTLDVTGTGRFSSTLTASNGLTQTTGALNLTATSGALTISGLSSSSISFGVNNILFTSGNFNTTATGINTTDIGVTTPAAGNFTSLGLTTPGTGAFTTLTSSGNTTLATGASTTNTFGSGASSANTIGSTTTPGALTLHGPTTLDNSLTSYGGSISLNNNSNFATNINTGTSTGAVTIGGNLNTIAIDSSDWDISTTGVLTGISGITTDGPYTQSGISANTFTGTSTFSNATYSALFTGGNVGIGTTAPGQKLHIGAGHILLDNNYEIRWKDSSGTERTGVELDSSNNFNLGTSAGGDILFRGASYNELARITSTGNVGIGDTAPTSKLSVLASLNSYAATYIRNSGTGAALQLNQQGTGLIFEALDSSTPVFVIQDGGNVGIGTTAPSKSLQISAAQSEIQLTSTTGTNRVSILFDNTGAGMGLMGVENSVGGDLLVGSSPYAFVFGSSGAVPVQIGANNAVAMTLSTSGNVGIGTTAPGYKLDVNGGTYGELRVYGTDEARLRLSNTSAGLGKNWALQINTVEWGDFAIKQSAASQGDAISGTARLYINNAGNVGIGTTAPTQKLDVRGDIAVGNSGTVAALTRITNTGGTFYVGLDNSTGSVLSGSAYTASLWHTGNYPMVFATNNTERVRISNSGNVGIGTTGPSYTLDVTGTGRFTGALTVGGALTLTGSILPSADDTYDLGSDSYRWKDLWLGAETLHIGTADADEGEISYTTSTNVLNIQSNGNIALQASSGNVGIGTTGPDAKLQIGSNGATTMPANTDLWLNNDLRFSSGGDSDSSYGMYFKPGWTGAVSKLTIGGQHAGVDSDVMTILRSGNVGIGTTSPGSKLDVVASSGDHNSYFSSSGAKSAHDYGMMVYNTSTDGADSLSKHALYVQSTGAWNNPGAINYAILATATGGTSNYSFYGTAGTLYNAGNVGIGTTGPSGKLHVALDTTSVGTAWKAGVTNVAAVTGADGVLEIVSNQGGNVGSAITFAEVDATPSFIDKWGIYRRTTAGGSDLRIGYGSSADFWSNSDLVTIKTTGNVGIGTTTPGNNKVWINASNSDTPGTGSLAFGIPSGSVPLYNFRISSGGVNSLILDRGNSGTSTPVMIWERTTGNVGIGTTSPGYLLDIYSAPATGSNLVTARVESNPGNNAGSTILRIEHNAYNSDFEMNGASTGFRYGTIVDTNIVNNAQLAGAYGNINFVTGNTGGSGIAMTIGGGSQKGNVGIGTTGPDRKLDVTSTGNGIISRASGTGGAIAIYGYNTQTTGTNYGLYGQSTGGSSGTSFGTIGVANGTGSGSNINVGLQGYAANGVNNIQLLLGQVAVPSGSFGIYNASTANNYIAGNVGIGTTSPTSKLDIRPAYDAQGLVVNGSQGDVPSIRLVSTSSPSTNTWDIRIRNGANDAFSIYDVGNSLSRLAIIPSTGNVGIGTTGPQDKLEVAGNIRLYNIAADNEIIFQDQNIAHGMTALFGETGGNSIHARIMTLDGANGGIDLVGATDADGSAGARLYGVLGVTDPTDSIPAVIIKGAKKNTTNVQALGNTETVLQVQNNTSALMTILGSGNVGIGTASPLNKLDIYGTPYSSSYPIIQNILDTTSFAQGVGGGIGFGGKYSSGGAYAWYAAIQGIKEDATDSTYAGALRLMTRTQGNSSFSEQVRITSTGNVGIGTTTPGNNKVWINASNSDTPGTGSLAFGIPSGSVPLYNFRISSGGVNSLILDRGNSGTSTPVMIWERTTGNVGIGTTSPGGKLVIKGAGTTTGIGLQTQNSSGTALVTMLDNGNVGIGTTAPGAQLDLTRSEAGTASQQMALALNYTNTGTNSYNSIGRGVDALNISATAEIATNFNGIFIIPQLRNVASPNITNVTGVQTFTGYGYSGMTSGTVGTARGVWIKSFGGTQPQTFTNQYGLHIENITGATNNYAIYAAGTTDKSYFGGNVGIGTTSPGSKLDVVSQDYGLPVSSGTTQTYGGTRVSTGGGNIVLDTGLYNPGVWMQVTNKTDLSQKYSLALNPNGGNVGIGTTSPTNLLHLLTTTNRLGQFIQQNTSSASGKYGINTQVTGALSTGDNYAGYFLSSATGGTNNYAGYFSASGATNNYAIYSDAGTNYFSGNVGIGTTSPVQKLSVIGHCVTGDTLLPIRRRKKKKKDGEDEEEENEKKGKADKVLGNVGSDTWEYLFIPITDIQNGDEVLSLNKNNGKVEYHKIKALMDMGVKDVYELKTKSGRVIRTTATHPYLVRKEKKENKFSIFNF